ncbi:MAG: hypothetical protein EA402_06150 [Planctomycetota bacterium]|nr:MAG: hypothetical protein EA402_06150 [Planctomycetota bacterium]
MMRAIACAILLYFLLGCSCPRAAEDPQGADVGDEDPVASAFLAKHGAADKAASENLHPQIFTITPLPPQVMLARGERRGSTHFTLRNSSQQPWAIAQLHPHCRSCRITDNIPRRLDPGESIEIPLQIAIGMLERLPSQRFIELVVVTPDDQAHRQLIRIAIEREGEE